MKKALPWIVAGVILTFSLLFGLYVAFGPFQPEEEMRRMLTAMSQVETVKQSTGISWTRGEQRERTTTTLYTEGRVHAKAPDQVDHATRFRVVRISRANRTGDLSGEIRHLNEKTYLTYNPPGPPVDGVEFNDENTWISFESGQFPAWGALLPGVNPPLFTDNSTNTPWNRDKIAQMRGLLTRADVFDVEFNDLTTFVDNELTRVFDARFDPQALRAFLFEYTKIRTGEELTNEDRIRIEQIANGLEKLTIRMWIGADTHYLRKIQIAGALPEEPGSEAILPVDMAVKFSRFNEPFEVEAPSETLTFDQVLQETFGILPDPGEGFEALPTDRPLVSNETGQLPLGETEKVTDTDGDGLDDVTEAFFGTDIENPDTDGDGMSDGDEVSAGRNPSGPGKLFGFGL